MKEEGQKQAKEISLCKGEPDLITAGNFQNTVIHDNFRSSHDPCLLQTVETRLFTELVGSYDHGNILLGIYGRNCFLDTSSSPEARFTGLHLISLYDVKIMKTFHDHMALSCFQKMEASFSMHVKSLNLLENMECCDHEDLFIVD